MRNTLHHLSLSEDSSSSSSSSSSFPEPSAAQKRRLLSSREKVFHVAFCLVILLKKRGRNEVSILKKERGLL